MNHDDLPPAGFRRRRDTLSLGPWLDLAASGTDHLVLVDPYGQRYRIPVADVCAALIDVPTPPASR